MKIPFRFLPLDPEMPLGRRGCLLEHGKRNNSPDFFDGTPIETYYKSIDNSKKNELTNFVFEQFPDILSICRKSYLEKFNEIIEDKKELVEKLIEFKILSDDLKLLPNIESFGNLFECVVGNILVKNNIQNVREAKIKYPFRNKKYDPDGQLYDILGALDFSNLLWIECKNPLYLNNENPLGQVISKTNIDKFIRRSLFLNPNIAIYLVNTKEDYKSELRNLIKPEFLTSGNFLEYFEESDNIIARLNGFIYFNRVNYKSNKLFLQSITESINQVLYDSIKISRETYFLDILK